MDSFYKYMYVIGSKRDSLSAQSRPFTLASLHSIKNSAPIFGQKFVFGSRFAEQNNFSDFRQLVKSEPTIQQQTDDHKGSNEMASRYSHKSYGRKPIVEKFSH